MPATSETPKSFSSADIYFPLLSPPPESVYDISMAIHADYPGLTVEVYVDGKPLEEYEHEEEQEKTKTTTRYIECRSGAEFAIGTNFKSPFVPMDIVVCVRLDEGTVDKQLVFKTDMLIRPVIQSKTRWEENGTWRASNFLFSDLSVGK